MTALLVIISLVTKHGGITAHLVTLVTKCAVVTTKCAATGVD